jgi:hypothetical protein
VPIRLFLGKFNQKKKNETPEIDVRHKDAIVEKIAVRETTETRAETISENLNVQPEINSSDQTPQVTMSAQDESEPVTLWDSLVVKKGKGGDHEKPKKKNQGMAVNDNSQEES